jgi:hypothetical protein
MKTAIRMGILMVGLFATFAVAVPRPDGVPRPGVTTPDGVPRPGFTTPDGVPRPGRK